MKKTLYLLGAAVIGSCALGFGVASVSANNNEEFKLLGTLNESYFLGESLTIPDCIVEVNGKNCIMARTVIYPDGRTSAYQTVTLDSLGEYSVVYTYDNYENTLSFETEVLNKASLFSVIENATVEANVDAGSWAPEQINGVGITFTNGGGKVRYNEVLDLRNKSRFEYFLECIANPAIDGDREIDYIYITLTDIYNENNYIKLRLQSSTLRGGSPNGVYITTTANDMYDYIAYAPEYWEMRASGYNVEMGLAGSGTEKYPKTGINTLRLSYLSEEKEMWAQAYPFQSQGCLMDYDDPQFVDERYLWNGFSADLAYMTIEVDNDSNSMDAGMLFTSINGTSLSGIGDFDSKEFFFDVDTMGYSEDELPTGKVGKKYPVFKTRVFDNFGREVNDINATVYAPNGNAIPIVQGYFQPTVEGEYTLEYRAENNFHFERKHIKIMVAEEIEPVSYSFSSQFVNQANYGDKVFIYAGKANGGIGKLDVRMEITLSGQPVELYDYGGGKFFIASLSGRYAVKTVVTDWSGEEVEFVHEIFVAEPSAPIMEEPVLAKSAIVGRAFKLPCVDAIMLKNSEKVYVPVKVYVGDNDVTETLRYVPQSEAEISVRYVAQNPFGGEDTEKSFTISVRDTATLAEDEFYIDAFLKMEGFTREYVNNYYTLVTDGESENAKLSFALPVIDEFLALNFSVEEGYGNFESATVTFTDTENAEECLQLQIRRRMLNGTIVSGFYLNGEFINSLEASMDGGGANTFGFNYDKKNKAILNAVNEKICDIKNNAYWDIFNGFSSGYAYIDFEIDGISDVSKIRLIKISSQNVTSASSDRIAPSFVFDEDSAEAYTAYVNDYFTVRKVRAYDVLSDTVTVSMTITAPDGSIVYSGAYKDGYSFKIEKEGFYSIGLVATDGSKRSASYEISIKAFYFRRPEIIVSNVPTTAKVGTAIEIPKPTVLEEYTASIYVVTPNGYETVLTLNDEGKYTYVFDRAGTYQIKYVLVDAYENRAIKVFEVNV